MSLYPDCVREDIAAETKKLKAIRKIQVSS